MKKSLPLVRFGSLNVIATLGASMVLGGCGTGFPTPSATQQPVVRGSCTLAATPAGRAASQAMADRFGSILRELRELTPEQRDALFVDRDVKGRALHFRDLDSPNPDAPVAPVWAQQDFQADHVPGTGTARARAELGLRDNGAPVIVAVIDSAVDIDHPALKDHVWTDAHPDDQHPGAVHGWNFLGGPNGNVYHTTLEVTRELKRLTALKNTRALTDAETALLARVQAEYDSGKNQAATRLAARTRSRDNLSHALDILRSACQIQSGSLTEVESIQTNDPGIQAAQKLAIDELSNGKSVAKYNAAIDYYRNAIQIGVQYYYNLNFDSSTVVGDHPDVMAENYGSADVKPVSDDEEHATHVSGIIGAIRIGTGRVGMQGQASNVRIMPLRAVPDGDERDKDIGNAIRFAADHGARVINMSFGKYYSPNKAYVWDSIRYAGTKGVLLVHAAGNDALDNNSGSHFPDREVRDDSGNLVETLPNVIEVGASTRFADKRLPANFSCFGSRTVDLFSPGQTIYSTLPSGHYGELDGTSMATPEVAGIAALVLSQYPTLTVAQLKEALLVNVTPFRGLQVVQPTTDPAHPSLIDFAQLSQRGGVVNAYEALKAAARVR